MDQICAAWGITRQAHYQKVKRETQRQVDEEIILEMVRQIRRKHPRLGTRKLLFKIQPMMVTEGLQIGRDRLFHLLRERDMLIQRKKAHRRTTIPGFWRTPNLLLGMTISQPNQVWVSDITYLEVAIERFAYLFLLMDLYSRFIIGWHVASSLAAEGAVLIHHSDHGVQYTSHSYMDILFHTGIRPSMGEVGNCYDNIFAERVIGTLKNEYGLDALFQDPHQVSPAVNQAIHFYNTDRPHLSLNMAVPRDVYIGLHGGIPPVIIPDNSLCIP